MMEMNLRGLHIRVKQVQLFISMEKTFIMQHMMERRHSSKEMLKVLMKQSLVYRK